MVLELIVQGKGSNNLVGKHRGLKSKLLDMPEEPNSDDDEVVQRYISNIGTDLVPPIDSLQQLSMVEDNKEASD